MKCPTKYIVLVCLLYSKILASQELAEIFLWPKGAPGSEGKTGAEKVRIAETGDHVISNINNPSVTPYLPPRDSATGAAVIIAPGGGHTELWIEHEGYNIAHILRDHGIAAFVLKYRLAREPNSTYKVEVHALADMQRAIKMVRKRAKEWNIDTAKIGVMGFSAGGEVAALSAANFDKPVLSTGDETDRQTCRPAFQALIYPGNSKTYKVNQNSPRVFIACGYNDRPDISEGMATLYLEYKKLNIPAELHIYSNAAHGFGVRKKDVGEITTWPLAFINWLLDPGTLK